MLAKVYQFPTNKKILFEHLENIEVQGIDTKDYPDYVDAYFSYAYHKYWDRPLTDSELEQLTEDYPEELHNEVMSLLY